MQFVQFSYYKTANHIAPCGVMRCGAILLAVRYGYAILLAVFVRFLRFVRFMWFGEHPYMWMKKYMEMLEILFKN